MTPAHLAKILIKDTDTGRYLILRSSEWPENPRRSHKPDLPGGIVEEGETPIVGALRELEEEAGIHLKPTDLQLVYETSERHDGKDFLRHVYYTELKGPKVTLSWEHDKYWWKSADEILAMEIRDPYPQIFQILKKEKLLI